MESVVEQMLAVTAVDPAPYERVALRVGIEAAQDCAQACVAGRRAREACEEFLPIHHHCGLCARACRAAEVACRALLSSVQTEHPVTDYVRRSR